MFKEIYFQYLPYKSQLIVKSLFFVNVLKLMFYIYACLSRCLSGKESACQCRRHRRCGFDPWVRNITQSRKRLPVPVFLPAKFHEHRSLMIERLRGHKESNMIENMRTHMHEQTHTCTHRHTCTHTYLYMPSGLSLRKTHQFYYNLLFPR